MTYDMCSFDMQLHSNQGNPVHLWSFSWSPLPVPDLPALPLPLSLPCLSAWIGLCVLCLVLFVQSPDLGFNDVDDHELDYLQLGIVLWINLFKSSFFCKTIYPSETILSLNYTSIQILLSVTLICIQAVFHQILSIYNYSKCSIWTYTHMSRSKDHNSPPRHASSSM